MTSILSAIYCWLQGLLGSFWDLVLSQWDSLLFAADGLLSNIGGTPWTFSSIPTQYAWILGATGMAECLTIIASALAIRFLLQAIPFVRWGT